MPTVVVYWSPGRTEKQKADVIHEVTDTLVSKGGARREDVLIIFQEIKSGDAGRGGRVIGSPTSADGASPTDSETL